MLSDTLDLLFGNLGVSMSDALLIFAILGAIIVMAVNFRIGLLFLFTLLAGLFIVMYNAGMETIKIVFSIFIVIILFVFSLWISMRAKKEVEAV